MSPCFREDTRSLQKLTCWLEDTRIRRREVSKRGDLRTNAFLPALGAYLRELDAPFVPPSDDQKIPEAVTWLVDIALRLHFDDREQLYNVPYDPWEGRCVPVVSGAADDSLVAERVLDMLRCLQVDAIPPSSVDGLKVIADIATDRLSSDQLMEPMDMDEEGSMSLDDLPLGFSTGDAAVDQVAKVLRILHIRELRRLQNRVNAAIAAMQTVTANPKTDAKLGKVGR